MPYQGPVPPQAGQYGVILGDPAWEFKTYSEKGAGKSPEAHYDTMTLDDIADLPVKDWAAPDCVLALWMPWPKLVQIVSPRITYHDDGSVTIKPPIPEAWGFKYSGLLWEWRKYNAETGKFSFGGGLGGTRKNLEPCLLYRRGSPGLFNRSQRDFIDGAFPDLMMLGADGDQFMLGDFLDAQRREHSRKPDEQYARIEAMFDGPYLEMFATQSWPGWDHWAPKAHEWRDSRKEAG